MISIGLQTGDESSNFGNFRFVIGFFRPSATVRRIGPTESPLRRCCHYRWCEGPPPWAAPPKLSVMKWAALWSHVVEDPPPPCLA